MQQGCFWMIVVLGGLLLAAIAGGDGLHAAEVHRVYLPVVQGPMQFSGIGPVVIPTATPEGGPG